MASGYYFLRVYDAAVEVLRTAIRSYPDHPLAYHWLAAALGQLGRVGEAWEALQKAIVISPKSLDMYVRNRNPSVRPEDYEHMLEGLRKAGWNG
jgi:adenylate cyclase